MANEHDDLSAIDALDREWEALRQGRAPSPALDAATGATVRRLHQLPDAPGPDTAFVNRLEWDLMAQAEATTAGMTRGLPLPRSAESSNTALASHVRRRWSGTRVLELVAAALLIALIGGGLYLSRGPGQPTQPPPTMTTGFALETVPAAASPETTPTAGTGDGTAMYLGNAARSGAVAETGPQHQPAIIDAIDIAPDVVTSGQLLATADTVYLQGMTFDPDDLAAPGERVLIVAIDRASGQERWRFDLGSTAQFGEPALAVAEGRLYVSLVRYDDSANATSGALLALDARSGREVWLVEVPEPGLTAPAVANGVVYAGSHDGAVLAFDAESGDELWRATAPRVTSGDSLIWSSVVAVDRASVFAAGENGRLFALNAATGEERWQYDPGVLANSQPVVAGGRVFLTGIVRSGEADVALGPDRLLVALDADTGDELWRVDMSAESSDVAVVATEEVVVIPHFPLGEEESAQLVAFDAATGAQTWSFSAEKYLDEFPIVAGDTLYTTGWDSGVDLPGSLQGVLGLGQSSHLYAIDLATGQQLWRVETDQMYTRRVAISNGDLLLLDHLGHEGNESNAIFVYGDDPT